MILINPYRFAVSGGGASSYADLVTAAAPDLWWRLGETSGTTAADSGSGGNNGTLTGGATFGGSVSIAAPSGYAGIGGGIYLSEPNVTDVRGTCPANSFGAGSGSSWTVVVWLAGSTGGSQYIASRQNNAAIIYGFTANTVEFFSLGGSGSDPRTGSGISLPSSDDTTPHMIVYRYDNGQWAGFKDGASVFNVARSFSLLTSVGTVYLGSDSSTSVCNSRVWDFQTYARALSDTEISDMYAARNVT